MNENKNEALKKYDQRETFWSQQSLNQLGYSINIFLTIGIGFLAYLISLRSKYPKIYFNIHNSINWNLLIYSLTVLALFLSVLFGSSSVISRLYDLRITRHITGIRKIMLKVHNHYMPEGEIDLTGESLFLVFFKINFRRVQFIHINPNSIPEIIDTQFNNLRKITKLLGRLTWKTHKIQVVLVLISSLIYATTIF
jgi:hypothetical protein